MPSFIAKRWFAGRSSIGRAPHARRSPLGLVAARARPRKRPAAEEGFLLIEVIVSAMIVGLIVVATFTGFDVVNRSSTDERLHDEAAVLAAQSQEQLRSDPANALAALQTSPHVYTQTASSTTFTIKQEASFVNDKEPTASCQAAGSKQSNQTGNYLRITSSVTWPELGTRSPVRQSSVITPPTGSALEVDVGNAPTPTAGVAGVTAIANYTAAGTGASGSLEATTGEPGCVVFGGIPATAAVVEIPEKTGYVTPGGELQIPPKEEAIAPNITTHDHVTFNAGGNIEAHFLYEGKTEYQGLTVTGDTFVVANAQIPLPPQFELGSTSLAYEKVGEERYLAATGSYKKTAFTPSGLKYPQGDLFPFLAYPAEPEWSAYSGDCGENEPFTVSKSAVKPGKGTVVPGKTTEINVPMSFVKLELYEGYFSNPGKASERAFPVSIANPKCAGIIPNNSAVAVTTKHVQKTISGKAYSQLEFPFQPFGTFELCLYNEKEKRSDKISYENLTATGSNPKIYLGEATASERAQRKTREVKEEEEVKNKRLNEEKAARKPKEEEETKAKEKRATEEAEANTAKEKRVSEEAAAKTAKEKREKEETEQTAAKAKREKEEKEAREKWLAEEKQKSKPITKAQRETKEKEQKTTREADEKAEKTAKEKREKEETEAKTAKTKREGEETAAKGPKEAREKAETEAIKAREAREKEEAKAREPKEKVEAETAKARETRETEEAKSATESKVVVESGNLC